MLNAINRNLMLMRSFNIRLIVQFLILFGFLKIFLFLFCVLAATTKRFMFSFVKLPLFYDSFSQSLIKSSTNTSQQKYDVGLYF